MMKNKNKKLTIKLADILELHTLIFLEKHRNELEIDDDCINLVISSHLSSLFTLLRNVSNYNEEIKMLVDDLIKNIINAVEKSKAITGTEVIYDDKKN